MDASPGRTVAFAAAVCVVCAAVVSSSAVLLRDRQQANAQLDLRRNVLEAAGLARAGEGLDAAAIEARFEDVAAVPVDTPKGPAPKTVYQVRDDDGTLRMLVLPVEGKGLWSTLRGFLALDADLVTIRGITFYSHLETPGLGGEVDNPRWKAKWIGRRAFDDEGQVRIEVAKGPAGSPQADPFRVDGLSGATITSRGVTDLLHVWLGEQGFGPYLRALREEKGG